MSNLDKRKLTCAKCVGNCCTFTSNSMRVTPLEAVEMILYLEESNLIDHHLVEKLESNIREFRLDKETLFGIKKNYTCPFYLGSCQGCSISRGSNLMAVSLLMQLKKMFLRGKIVNQTKPFWRRDTTPSWLYEKVLIFTIKNTLNLSWEKESIPIALLDIIKKGELSSPEI